MRKMKRARRKIVAVLNKRLENATTAEEKAEILFVLKRVRATALALLLACVLYACEDTNNEDAALLLLIPQPTLEQIMEDAMNDIGDAIGGFGGPLDFGWPQE